MFLPKIISVITLASCLVLLISCAAAVLGGAATGVAVVHDRRSPGTVLDDQGIEIHAHKMIAEVKRGNPRIRVVPVSYNNNLLLLGQVPDEFTRNQMVSRVRSIEKVRQVINEITLNEPLPLPVRTNDTWITTRIKSDMMLNKIVDPSRIKVVTEDAVVYLMGIVHAAEEEEAVAIARQVPGVDRVVKLLERI